MKRCVKSYLVFTSLLYRIVMFVIIPIIMIGLLLWFEVAYEVAYGEASLSGSHEKAVYIIVMIFLPMVEIISDNWLFGGIQSKDVEKLDYMKTSGAGMQVIRSALSMDLLRKLLSAVGITGILYWITMLIIRGYDLSFAGVRILLCAVLVSYFCSALGTMLARYGSTVYTNMMIASVFWFFVMLCMALVYALEFDNICCLLFAILDVSVSILAVKAAMKKMEGSYYDK